GDAAGEVGDVGPDPVVDAALDRGDGGQMEHAVDLFHRLAHGDAVGDVADHQRGFLGRVLPAAGGEIVENADFVLFGDQGVGEMRSDEAATAGDQISRHEGHSLM